MCFGMQAGKTALMMTENAEVADTLGYHTCAGSKRRRVLCLHVISLSLRLRIVHVTHADVTTCLLEKSYLLQCFTDTHLLDTTSHDTVYTARSLRGTQGDCSIAC